MLPQLKDTVIIYKNNQKNRATKPAANIVNWPDEALFNFLVTEEDTQGKYALIETVQRQGHEPFPQTHPISDVVFYVMAGEMAFTVDGQTIAAPAGSNVFISKGQTYAFTVKTETANTLILFSPAISQEYYQMLRR